MTQNEVTVIFYDTIVQMPHTADHTVSVIPNASPPLCLNP